MFELISQAVVFCSESKFVQSNYIYLEKLENQLKVPELYAEAYLNWKISL
jgi:hypothetical protein